MKTLVDDVIDQCSDVVNLRDSIETTRARAEDAVDDKSKKAIAQKGS